MNATYDHELVKRMIEEAVKAEREVVANWIMDKGFATGHGDSIVDLLDQLEWQIAQKEREEVTKERDRMCEHCKWRNDENSTLDETNQSKVLGKS